MAGSTNEILEKISELCITTNKLLSILITQDMQQVQAIPLLSKAGLQPKQIAELLGTTPNAVSVTLTKLKKKSKL